MYCRVFVLILTAFFSCKQVVPTQTWAYTIDNSLTLLKLGLPDVKQLRAMNTVAEKYGFSFKNLGCTIPKEYWDKFHKHNDSVNTVLQSRFGKNWYLKFADEVEKMEVSHAKILDIVLTQDYIINENTLLDKTDTELYFNIDLTEYKNLFRVKAYSYRKAGDTYTRITFYTMLVDIKKQIVILL